MTESSPTSHHAAPLRVVKVRGEDYAAVDDMAAMFTEMAKAMPEAKLGQVLTMLVESIGARPQDNADFAAEVPAQPCRACGVRVQTFPHQDESRPDVVLNARPVPHGQWMVTRTRDRVLAIPFDSSRHHSIGVARFREHSCAGPFGAPVRRTAETP